MELYDSEADSRSFKEIWIRDWGMLLDCITENHQFASYVVGHCAEIIWEIDVLKQHDKISYYEKIKGKRVADYKLIYELRKIISEVKCVSSRTVKIVDDHCEAKVAIHHRDRRVVTFPDGSKNEVFNVHRGEYDLLVVNLFPILGQHKWAYINANLMDIEKEFRAKSLKGLTEDQKKSGFLFKQQQAIMWPLQPPWTENLDEAISSIKGKI